MGQCGFRIISEVTEVARALRRAVDFLLHTQACNGESCWTDFCLPLGPSDEWITAYTACALAESEISEALRAANHALAWLEGRSSGRTPGFRYSAHTAPDADSTLWALRLAELLNVPSAWRDGAASFLQTCRRPDGGFATYPSASAVGRAIRVPADWPVNGWAHSHPCVSAAAGALNAFRHDPDLRHYLRTTQLPSGAWGGYWWHDPEYATALALRCLATTPSPDDHAAIGKAISFLSARATVTSPFLLALRIQAFASLCPQSPDGFGALVTALCRKQRPDGSWNASARLRVPHPHLIDPDRHKPWTFRHNGFGSVQFDRNRIFTTATAISALSAVIR